MLKNYCVAVTVTDISKGLQFMLSRSNVNYVKAPFCDILIQVEYFDYQTYIQIT